MKISIKKAFICLLATGTLALSSCGEEETINPIPAPGTLEHSFGWSGEDNVNTIPTSTNFGFGSTSNLPSSVDITNKFPPIGNQGNYGTCVAWAVAYNTKTAMYGMRKNLAQSALSQSNNQFSPKDMFTALPDNKKGANCNGTNFSEALTLMQNRGVATVQTVPYTNLGGCQQSTVQSNWTSEANQNKIKYWRRIDASVASIKQNLSNNIPVICGAKLADNFMQWNSDEVISSSTTTNQVGQHAYHAMVIAGYDDSKGANGAFRVINSWGQNWGDVGYIWIDYNYFMNDFCVTLNGGKPLFIMADGDGDGNVTPPDEQPNPTPSSGVDLASWVFDDYSTYGITSNNPNERVIDFNLYNIGSSAASPSANWSIYYIYFNAYDASDYGVIFYDDFNTSVTQNTFQCPTSNNCVFNLTIPKNNSFAQAAWNAESIERSYNMPNINGAYYLVMLADAEDKFQEQDEINNMFYTTLNPIFFQNGYAARTSSTNVPFKFENKLSPTIANLKNGKFSSIVTETNRNAYSKEEILDFFTREKLNGNLDAKVNKTATTNSTPYASF